VCVLTPDSCASTGKQLLFIAFPVAIEKEAALVAFG
jgi:hypothetical protein